MKREFDFPWGFSLVTINKIYWITSLCVYLVFGSFGVCWNGPIQSWIVCCLRWCLWIASSNKFSRLTYNEIYVQWIYLYLGLQEVGLSSIIFTRHYFVQKQCSKSVNRNNKLPWNSNNLQARIQKRVEISLINRQDQTSLGHPAGRIHEAAWFASILVQTSDSFWLNKAK